MPLLMAESRQLRPKEIFAANSFVFPERGLNSFVMPDVETHYPVSSCNCSKQGGGEELSISKPWRPSGAFQEAHVALDGAF